MEIKEFTEALLMDDGAAALFVAHDAVTGAPEMPLGLQRKMFLKVLEANPRATEMLMTEVWGRLTTIRTNTHGGRWKDF